MRKAIITLGVIVCISACATTQPSGTKVIFKDVQVEVPRPCPVTKPAPPSPLVRPLPSDPARLVDLLVAKLIEWAGPGGYGERADAALDTCIKE